MNPDFITSQDFQKWAKWWPMAVGLPWEEIKPGDIFYVRRWTKILPLLREQLTQPYILLSNFHDNSVEGPVAEETLADPLLIRWYSVNAALKHEKLTPIPMAIDASRKKQMARIPEGERSILLYANFRLHSAERREVAEIIKGLPFVYWADHDKNKPMAYYEALSQSKFVICPPGHGMDTYRIWEALAMGAIPIVKSSFLDPLFERLPVLRVPDWRDITLPLLEHAYEEYLDEPASHWYRWDVVSSTYWEKRIKGESEVIGACSYCGHIACGCYAYVTKDGCDCGTSGPQERENEHRRLTE